MQMHPTFIANKQNEKRARKEKEEAYKMQYATVQKKNKNARYD